MRLKTAFTAILCVMCAHAFAATPAGLWKTVDDSTGKEKSLVRITDENGILTGKVEKVLDPAKQGAVCEKCTDDRKDKPVEGLTIIRNLKKTDDGVWEKGDVLDPANGKVYKAKIKLLEDGRKLQLRGYLGPFYRTQVWDRVQ